MQLIPRHLGVAPASLFAAHTDCALDVFAMLMSPGATGWKAYQYAVPATAPVPEGRALPFGFVPESWKITISSPVEGMRSRFCRPARSASGTVSANDVVPGAPGSGWFSPNVRLNSLYGMKYWKLASVPICAVVGGVVSGATMR